MSDELLELAERCEKATGPDRELDVLIALATGLIRERDDPLFYGRDGVYVLERGYYDHEGGAPELPYPTASLNAAMALVPEGWQRWIYDADDGRCICRLEREEDGFEVGVNASTWALSVCAAALRSKHKGGE